VQTSVHFVGDIINIQLELNGKFHTIINYANNFSRARKYRKWKIDPPEMILDGAMQGHYQMIKQLRGVPGVQPERFQDSTLRSQFSRRTNLLSAHQ
jgi:hypothetical protein